MLEIEAGGARFEARLEEGSAPQTVAAFRRLLPLESKLIHARWSGEACWIPFGTLDVGIGPENATAYPGPGELLLYPGGISEMEILFPYGPTQFASKAGVLAGNHFATIVKGGEQLRELGPLVLWQGPQALRCGGTRPHTPRPCGARNASANGPVRGQTPALSELAAAARVSGTNLLNGRARHVPNGLA